MLLFVPPNCTGVFQPLDVTVNAVFKRHYRNGFNCWATNEVQQQIERDVPLASIKVDLRQSVMKNLMPFWIASAWKDVSIDLVVKGWQKAGLLRAWDSAFQDTAMDMAAAGKLFQLSESGTLLFEATPEEAEPDPGEASDGEASGGAGGSESGSEDEGSSGSGSSSSSEDEGLQQSDPLVLRLLRRSSRTTVVRRNWESLLGSEDEAEA